GCRSARHDFYLASKTGAQYFADNMCSECGAFPIEVSQPDSLSLIAGGRLRKGRAREKQAGECERRCSVYCMPSAHGRAPCCLVTGPANAAIAAHNAKRHALRAWRFNLLRLRRSLASLLQCDFYVHTCGQVQAHQGVDGFIRGIDDVHEALVSTHFELIARRLVDVRRTQYVVAADTRR